MVENRNIAVYIILSIVTCGIFGLFWMITLNDDTLKAVRENGTSGGVVLLLSIITCGIYSIYWMYVIGTRIDKIKNNPNGSTGWIYLLLSVFGFSIIAYAIAQDELNKFALNSENSRF